MCFVNYPKALPDQNVAASQNCGDCYNPTNIYRGTELQVSCGENRDLEMFVAPQVNKGMLEALDSIKSCNLMLW